MTVSLVQQGFREINHPNGLKIGAENKLICRIDAELSLDKQRLSITNKRLLNKMICQLSATEYCTMFAIFEFAYDEISTAHSKRC